MIKTEIVDMDMIVGHPQMFKKKIMLVFFFNFFEIDGSTQCSLLYAFI